MRAAVWDLMIGILSTVHVVPVIESGFEAQDLGRLCEAQTEDAMSVREAKPCRQIYAEFSVYANKATHCSSELGALPATEPDTTAAARQSSATWTKSKPHRTSDCP
jgi:hypothetical protein